MTTNRFGIALDDAGSPDHTDLPAVTHLRGVGYSSAVDASERLRARRSRERWWEASETNFGLAVRLLLTLPLLAIVAVLVWLGVQYSLAALMLLFLALGGVAWFLKELWMRR